MSMCEGGTVTWIIVHTRYWKTFIDREIKCSGGAHGDQVLSWPTYSMDNSTMMYIFLVCMNVYLPPAKDFSITPSPQKTGEL